MGASAVLAPILPSIEDKIDRFADKDRHQVFVELGVEHLRDLRQRIQHLASRRRPVGGHAQDPRV